MLHVARFSDEDHVLGDVGGVVADPLEVLGEHDHVELLRGRLGVAAELAQHRLHHLVLHPVDHVVLVEDGAREVRIGAREGVERAAQRPLRGARQGRGRRRQRHLGLRRQAPRDLRDVAREVAHALEIRRDHLDRQHLAQVFRNGRLQRQRLEHGFVDRDLESVDLDVVTLHLGRQRRVALPDRAHRLVDDGLGPSAHAEQTLAQSLDVGFDEPAHP